MIFHYNFSVGIRDPYSQYYIILSDKEKERVNIININLFFLYLKFIVSVVMNF